MANATIYSRKSMKKEDTKMKDTNYTKKLAYMGAGCGVVLFAVFGLLPGSFLRRSDGIEYSRNNVRHTGRRRAASPDDSSGLDGGRGNGIRDDVHHGLDHTGMAYRHCSGCDKGWKERTGNSRAQINSKQLKGGRVMTEGRRNTMKVGTKIGAGLGVLAFLVFGIIPGFYFGSYGTLILLSHLAGGPVEPTTIVRMLTVVGIMLGIFCVGAVSIVLGSVFGTAMGYVVDVVAGFGKVKETAEVKANH